MESLPYFKFYAAEYLSDEDILAMSFAERGLWQTLVARCWVEGSFPADIDKLARILGADATALRPLYEGIAGRFAPHPGDASRRISPRIERERAEALERTEAKSEAGRAAAKARWSQRNSSNADALRPQCERNAIQTQNQTQMQSQTQTPWDGGGRDKLAGFRSKLAQALGVPKVGRGRTQRGVDAVSRWLRLGVPEDELVAECVRLAREQGVTPAHLTWWAGWLDTVSDEKLKRSA